MTASTKPSWTLRSSIVLALMSLVATILWFTPLIDVDFASCERECRPMDWPMICRIKLTFEVYQTFSRSCGDCPHNVTDCSRKYCIIADGHQRGLLSANRQLPGPTIQVCENDILLVDVINRIPGQELAIHWRGQPQKETPVMDGVPMVTQCPIPSYTTFQYRFRASNAGTHLWHAHIGSQTDEGLFGALIVRQPDIKDPMKNFYDVDDKKYLVLINEWNHGPLTKRSWNKGHARPTTDTLLISGHGYSKTFVDDSTLSPLTVFNVLPQKRYRFRLAYTGGKRGCLITLFIDKHDLTVITLDGNPIKPITVTSVVLAPGERMDVVLETNRKKSTYLMKASTVEECGKPVIKGTAVIQYSGTDFKKLQNEMNLENNLVETEQRKDVILHSTIHKNCKLSDHHDICIADISSLNKMDEKLSALEVDTQLYISYGFRIMSASEISSFSSTVAGLVVPHVNNVTFIYPPFPLISQSDQVNPELICNKDSIFVKKCHKAEHESTCECIHVIDIPLGNTVELVLVHQGEPDDGHVFHLHGYSFHVVGVTQLPEQYSIDKIKSLDKQGKLLLRNLVNPPIKDTLFIPNNGIAVIRLLADNPGYWLLNDERMSYWMNGLNVILHVGNAQDIPPLPQDFPTCGSWVGPELSLI